MTIDVVKLAEQAGFIEWGLRDLPEAKLCMPEHLERFAALVIEECAKAQEQRSVERHGYDKHGDSDFIRQMKGTT